MAEVGGAGRASWLPLLSAATLGVLASTWAWAWAWESGAHAASLHVSPVGIEMAPVQRDASVTITNAGSDPVDLRVRAYAWSQVEGRDVLEETADLAIGPATATVSPDASHVFHVSRLGVTAVENELSYRLIIEELPRSVEASGMERGVAMVLRISIPLFVADENATAELTWRLGCDARGAYVEVDNGGGRHARISELTLRREEGEPLVLGEGLNGYVLAGSRMRFDFPADGAHAPDPGEPVTLTAHSRGLAISETLHVEEP